MSYQYRCKNCGLLSNRHQKDDPVSSLIVCDGCGAETSDAVFDLPTGWVTVNTEDDDNAKDYTPTEHYCSRACLKRHEGGA